MITKVLFTILIVAAVLTYARHRTAARRALPLVGPAERPAPRYWRFVPAGLVLVVIMIGGLIFWLQWQEEHRLFTVRVTDTRSGEVRTYPVYRRDVHGRTFTTVDGRTVTLADVERMELVEGPPSR